VKLPKEAMEGKYCRLNANKRLSSEIQEDKTEERLKVKELATTSGEDI